MESRFRKLAFSGAFGALLLVFTLVAIFHSSGARFMQHVLGWGLT
jgi:hypothetical protein